MDHLLSKENKFKYKPDVLKLVSCLVLKEQTFKDLVAIEKRSHLVPYRTQKLSSSSASIANRMVSESSTLPV